MSLLQRSFSGAVLILAVLLLRALFLHRLPKRTFSALWEIAMLRLLLPYSVPSALSIHSLLRRALPSLRHFEGTAALPGGGFAKTVPQGTVFACSLIWYTGMAICLVVFAVSYLCCLRELKTALPVADAYVTGWLNAHPLRRRITAKHSDRFFSPLVYGLFRPCILLPDHMDRNDTEALSYILMHEYLHIRRFDSTRKLLAALTLCVHWFNPAVWIWYVYYNRDMELTCDELVLRQTGGDIRASYAQTLIRFEEQKRSYLTPGNCFSKNATEERIVAIMKTKKNTLHAAVTGCAAIALTALVFATSGTASAGTADALPDIERQIAGDSAAFCVSTESGTDVLLNTNRTRLSDAGNYYYIVLQNGTEGYVLKEYLDNDGLPQLAVEELAK